MSEQSFSKRQGFRNIQAVEITIREGAPEGLRGYIPVQFYALGKKPSDLRVITTRILKKAPDKGNWSEYPNIESEVSDHLEKCEWYYVYDIIEAIIQNLNSEQRKVFSDEMNEFFVLNGIGWKIANEKIETRGDEVFETAVKTVVSVLDTAGLPTAKTEIKEALRDLSTRPEPDITGGDPARHGVPGMCRKRSSAVGGDGCFR